MSKLVLDFQVPPNYDKNTITQIVRAICTQVNSLSEGKITASYSATSVAPSSTAQQYSVGDKIWDTQTTVTGASVAPGNAAQYVRIGWVCTTAGTGATAVFKEMRVLVGT